MINEHSELNIYKFQMKAIDGINDLLKVHDVPDHIISLVLKDIGLMNNNRIHGLLSCGLKAKEIQASWKVEEESDFMEDLKIGVRPQFPSIDSKE